MKEGLGGSVVSDDPVRIMKLKILETELDSPPVRFRLRVISRLQAEEEDDLYEFGRAMG